MSEIDVDGAYEWLMVIIGIVFAIMSQYPYFFWGDTPDSSASLQAVRSVVLPLVTSAILWLIGKLLININRKLLVKLVAWMFSLSMTISVLLSYLLGVQFLFIQSEQIQAILSNSILFVFTPIFVYGIVYPIYREKYLDAAFFKNKVWMMLVLVIYFVLIFGLFYFSAHV